jgi:hypothetical protein
MRTKVRKKGKRIIVQGLKVRMLTAEEKKQFKTAVHSTKPMYGNQYVLGGD